MLFKQDVAYSWLISAYSRMMWCLSPVLKERCLFLSMTMPITSVKYRENVLVVVKKKKYCLSQ